MQRFGLFKKNNIFLSIQLFLFISFCVLSLGLVFSNGICCGDDAYHAIIAKNLANGLGYTSTIQDSRSDFQVKLFDSHISVGLTVILPTAFLIMIFGNTYWVPGLSIVIIWMICLILIWRKLNKWIEDKVALTIAIFVFFILSYVFTAYHYEQWYAMLGEVPAALLTLLAILVYFDCNRKSNMILTGFIFFLASQSKLITLISFAMFIAYIFITSIISLKYSQKHNIKGLFQTILLILVGFIIPTLLFEGWKFISLGGKGYKAYMGEIFHFVGEKGSGAIQISSSFIVERIKVLVERFGIFLPAVLILIILIGVALRKEKKLSKISLCLNLVIFVYSIYWVFFSIGWARYYFICLIFIVFNMILPFVASKLGWKVKSIYALILALFCLYTINHINISHPLKGKLFEPTQYTLSILEMAKTLSDNLDKSPFITEWWGTAADMEYLLPGHYNIRTFKDPYFNFSRQFIIVANNKFVLSDDTDFQNFLNQCTLENNNIFIFGSCTQPINK